MIISKYLDIKYFGISIFKYKVSIDYNFILTICKHNFDKINKFRFF